MTPEKSAERSIDTLQRIYAVVAALAVNEAIRRSFLENNEFKFRVDYLPEFLAFVVTVVPFVHGMNRHLDATLTKSRNEKRPRLMIYVLVDFFVFILESAMLFMLAVSVTTGPKFFQRALLLLSLDVVWGIITWQITKAVGITWACINVIAVVAGIFLIYSDCIPANAKPWALAGLAGLRTMADYYFAWRFYFPSDSVANAEKG